MKTRPKIAYLSGVLALLIVSLTTSTPLLAATALATVSVKVVRNVSIINKADMSFGHISTSAAAGSIVLDHNGNRQAMGGAILETGGAHTPAKFAASGEPNASFFISLPSTTVMTDSKGNEMIVNGFSSTSEKVATFNSQGNYVLEVGATLHVNPNQELGNYTGSMSVSVNYD